MSDGTQLCDECAKDKALYSNPRTYFEYSTLCGKCFLLACDQEIVALREMKLIIGNEMRVKQQDR